MPSQGELRRGIAVVTLLVTGLMLLIKSPEALDDVWQCVGLVAGGLGVGAAAMMMRDSVLKS